MNIYTYQDYKRWVRDSIQSRPRSGRGQLTRIAQHLRTSPTIVTQVFNGTRELTAEQAILLAEFFALSKLETRYLILMVNFSRAGSQRYRTLLREEMEEIKDQSREISHRVRHTENLTDEAKSVLYANWYYLAIWSLTAIDGFNDLESISNRLGLAKTKARAAIDFLLQYGLIVEDDSGFFRVGPTMVHLGSQSSLLPRHHQNWRLRAFDRYEHQRPDDLAYTAVVTLSEEDAERIREKALQFISDSVKQIEGSPSEKLYCLCVDWFEA